MINGFYIHYRAVLSLQTSYKAAQDLAKTISPNSASTDFRHACQVVRVKDGWVTKAWTPDGQVRHLSFSATLLA